MNTITDKLAEALRACYREATDKEQPHENMRGSIIDASSKALAEYRANKPQKKAGAAPEITDEQIQELGERFGRGVSCGDGFIWFDGNPSEMIREAIKLAR